MHRVHAVFTNGAFVPNEPYDLPEGTEVELAVTSERHSKGVMDPPELSPEQRRAVIDRVIQQMTEVRLSPDAPRFTRDELHERR